MVAILEKSEHNTDFHLIVDLGIPSQGTQILATVDGVLRTVTESSLRRNLKLQDEDGISSLPDTEFFENLTLMGYNISPNQKFTFQKGQFSHQWKFLIHTIMQCLSPKSTGFNEFSNNIATAFVCLATNRTYNFSKMIFDGLVKNINNKVSKFLMYPRQYTRRARIAQSSALPPIADKPASPVRDVIEREACPTDSGFIADQDRATIAKSSTLPHDTAPRVTSPTVVEGSMQQTINELTALYTSLQRQHSELLVQFQAQKVEINKLNVRVKILEDNQGVIGARSADDAPIKGRRIDEEEGITGRVSTDTGEIRMDEGEVAVERTSEDTEEIAIVLTSMDATTVLAGGIDVPTGSYSIFTAGPPVVDIHTGSDAIPTASPIIANATVVTPYSRRKRKEVMVESDTPKKQRDAEVARIHAEEELQVWKLVEDFIPMGSKEEVERLTRKGFNLDQEKVKKHKTSEEHLDREDLNQLWVLVKEYLSIRPALSDKEMELWVELKRLKFPLPEGTSHCLKKNDTARRKVLPLPEVCTAIIVKEKPVLIILEDPNLSFQHKVHYSCNKLVVAKVSTTAFTSSISPDVAELKDMVRALLLEKSQSPAPVKVVEESCVTCGVNFNQGNTSYRPLMMSNQIRPPGFPPAPAYQAPATQTQCVSKEDFSAYVKANEAVMRNMQTQGQNMQNQLTNLTDLITKFVNSNTASTSSLGTLPSNTITNPRSDLKANTTQSGVSYDGPQIPPPPSSLPPMVENKPEATKDTVDPTNNGNTKDVQPQAVHPKPVSSLISEPAITTVSASRPSPKASIPYPSRRNNERNRERAKDQIKKFYQIFKDMNFEIRFADALMLMPKFPLTLKTLIENKEKLSEMAQTSLNKHCFAVLLKKLPKKLEDPGKFLIPCDFPGMAECLALADLGVSINQMPYSVWKEDVYVKVGSFHFPADFVIVDFDANPRVPLILGRSFLKTERALIDVFEGELTLRVGKEAITFNLDQTSRYSANYSDMTAKRIDVIDMASEEYSQEYLEAVVIFQQH
nr:reverse transcriptase domain-containing protein [Tanacetum cinerariifolium]